MILFQRLSTTKLFKYRSSALNQQKQIDVLVKRRIEISISSQCLIIMDDQIQIRSYRISTAKSGVGEVMGSGCTPSGRHLIRVKIGNHCEENTVFVGRRPTGEIYSPGLLAKFPKRDWMLARILWLCGCEPEKNRFGSVDTMRRYIYIHGCPNTEPMGVPLSHGCIRMRTTEIIELFDLVGIGTPVFISE
jgi:L,D-transpeptidase YbiS